MSFAIIETGGKQYKVSTSKILEVEKLETKIGETIKFKNVLLLNDDKNTEIGNPNIQGASVEAKLLDNVKDRTVLVFHKRRRKHSRKKNGHRQRHSKIASNSPTVPVSIDEEKKTNIFLRCNEPSIKNALNLNNASEQEIFSKLRDLKDSF